TLNGGAVKAADLKVPSSKSANDVAKRLAESSPRDGEVHILPAQGNIYMVIADGANLTVSLGADGILLVDTGEAKMSDKILSTVGQLASAVAATPTGNNCL